MKKILWRRGQSAVEFTLLLPVFVLIMISTIYTGMFVIDYLTLDNEAAQVARNRVLDGSSSISPAEKNKIVKTKLFFPWYKLDEDPDNCTACLFGNLNEDGEFVSDSRGEYVQVMIQATLTKRGTLLEEILPEKYTVSKIMKLQPTEDPPRP